MLNVNDRVYHKRIRANGIIVEIDESKERDKYKVVFLWAKYCDIKHGSYRGFKYPERKWQWCSEDQLTVTPMNGDNRVSVQTERSLGALVRNVCEIPYYRTMRGRNDIVIRYTTSGRLVHNGNPLVINERVVWNKFEQQQMMGEDIGIPVSREWRAGWVAKPFSSIGGKGIYWLYDGDGMDTATHYAQKPFNKVREFRVHIFMWMDNKVQMIQEKLIDDRSQLCWNKKQGGRFRTVYQIDNMDSLNYTIKPELVSKLYTTAVLACKRIKYDLGGVDLGMDEQGNVRVFEVNSRMGLREQSLFTYKRAFNRLKSINITEYKNRRFT